MHNFNLKNTLLCKMVEVLNSANATAISSSDPRIEDVSSRTQGIQVVNNATNESSIHYKSTGYKICSTVV